MSEDTKIIPHTFHSFYVFEYFKPSYTNKPNELYSDWPIIDRVIIGGILPGENKIKKFTSISEVRQYIAKDKNIKQEDFCDNFIKFSFDEISKYRQLFHRLVKHLKVEHKFEAKIDGQSTGLSINDINFRPEVNKANLNAQGCETQEGASAPCWETGGCTDNVEGVGAKIVVPGKYSCSAGFDDKGSVSWGGGSEQCPSEFPCAGGCQKTFEVERIEKCVPLTCEAGSSIGPVGCYALCEYVQPPIEQRKEALDCCCPPQIFEGEDTEPPPFSSTSSMLGMLDIEKMLNFEDIYLDRELNNSSSLDLNSQLNFIKSLSTDSNSDYRDAREYECNRNHTKNINGDILYDGKLIFDDTNFQKRLGAIERRIRNIKDIEPPSENPSQEPDAYKEDNLTIGNKIYKNMWEFDQTKFKDLFIKNKRFPSNRTRINDPTIASNITNLNYELNITATPKKTSFLQGSKKINSDKLGNFKFEINSSKIGSVFDGKLLEGDECKYGITIKLTHIFYIESEKQFYFFFDISARVDIGDVNFIWSAGPEFSPYPYRQEDGKYLSSATPNFKNQIFRKDIAIRTNKKSFIAKEGQEVVESTDPNQSSITYENGNLVKIKIPVNFVFEGSPRDLEIECFRFEKKESEFSSVWPCFKPTGKIFWNLDNLKLQIHGWWQNDFQSGLEFPQPLT